MATKRYKSTKMKAARIMQILRDSYEPGRQDKSKLAVYRNKIYPMTGIGLRTFWRYMKEIEAEQPAPERNNNPTLFD